MKNLKDRLTVLHTEDDVSFQDLSFDAFDFVKDTFEISDFCYIGFSKPLNTIYARIGTVDAEAGASTWTWEYFDGSDWTTLETHDDTKGLNRDGFIQWLRPDDETKTTVNGKEQYWYRLTHSLSQPTQMYAFGALFCDESDLKSEYAYIDRDSFYPDLTNKTHIESMVAARDRMLEELKVSAWDIFEHADTKKAATFLTLSIIINNASDSPDDKYSVLSNSYAEKYRTTKSSLLLSIDLDDDGVISEGEKKKPVQKRWQL